MYCLGWVAILQIFVSKICLTRAFLQNIQIVHYDSIGSEDIEIDMIISLCSESYTSINL